MLHERQRLLRQLRGSSKMHCRAIITHAAVRQTEICKTDHILNKGCKIVNVKLKLGEVYLRPNEP